MPNARVWLALVGFGLPSILAAGEGALADAEALYQAGRTAEAADAFARVIATGSGTGQAYFRLGLLMLRAGDTPQAVIHFEQAVVLEPQCADYWHWVGNGYAWAAARAPLTEKPLLGRKCREAYQRALEIDPNHLDARLGLMNFHRHVPRYLGGGMGRAREEAAQIARRDPVVGRYAEAVLLSHEKRPAAALSMLATVVRERPDYYSAHCLIGQLAAAASRRTEAVAALRRCLELRPADTDESHEQIRRRLAGLTGAEPSG